MKIQNQVCTLEQAKKLRHLGISQEQSHFMWFEVSNGDDEGDFEKEAVIWHPVLTQYNSEKSEHRAIGSIDSDFTTSDGEFCGYKEPSRAFTSAELGELLVVGNDKHFWNCHYNEHLGCWETFLHERTEDADFSFKLIHNEEGETEAESRAEMLIYLIENKYLTIESCNDTLNE